MPRPFRFATTAALASPARWIRGVVSPRVIVPAVVLTGIVGYAAWYLANRAFAEPAATFIGSGTLEVDDVEAGSRIGGRVVEVLVNEGDVVEAGQSLVRLEDAMQKARVEEAEAALAEAEARQRKLEAGYTEEEIRAARARHEQVQAQLKEAVNGPRPETLAAAEARQIALAEEYHKLSREARRYTELEREGLSTEQTREDIEAARDVAWQRLVAAQKELEELRAGTRPEQIAAARAATAAALADLERLERGFRREDIEAARAVARMARARVAQAKEDLSECVIRAPLTRENDVLRVETLDLQPGDLVAPGRPVLRLVFSNRLWLRAWVPEELMSSLDTGTEVRVQLVARPGNRFVVGWIQRVHASAEFTPRNTQTPDERARLTHEVRVMIQNPGDLRAGMAANLYLPAASVSAPVSGQ